MRLFSGKKSIFLIFVASLFLTHCVTDGDLPEDSVAGAEGSEGEDGLLNRDGSQVSSTMTIPSDMIHFDFDRDEIKEEYKGTLKDLATYMKENPEATMRIEGHCDEVGTIEYNLALGQRRAKAVKAFLMAFGVDSNRLTTHSYGKEKLLDASGTKEAQFKNRRAQFQPSNSADMRF